MSISRIANVSRELIRPKFIKFLIVEPGTAKTIRGSVLIFFFENKLFPTI